MSLRSKLYSLIPRIAEYTAYEICRNDELTPPAPAADLQIEPVTVDNVARIGDFRSPAVVAEYRASLSHGYAGVYAFCDGRAVGHAWAATRKRGSRWIGGVIRATPETACIHRCHVDPNYRGRKIYQHMLAALVRLVFDSHDARRIAIHTNVANAPSIAAIERIGFRRLYSAVVLSWCGREFRLRKR